MTQIQKVPATAGAEWVMGGFALLRRAPAGLASLGLIWMGLSAVAAVQVGLSLMVALLGPILFGGLLYAVREVDQGRAALPTHLLQGLREGKTLSLLATLIPQILALIAAMLLLFALLGTENVRHMLQVFEKLQVNPENPDPALIQSLPTGQLFVWFIGVMVILLVAGMFTLLATPQVMFSGRGGLESMATSMRACVHNLGAMAVMVLILAVTMLVLALASNLVVLIAALMMGATLAAMIGQMLLMAVLLPVMGGTAYYAWRDILGGGVTSLPMQASSGFEA